MFEEFTHLPTWRATTVMLRHFPEFSDEILQLAANRPPSLISFDSILQPLILASLQYKRHDLTRKFWEHSKVTIITSKTLSYYAISRQLAGDSAQAIEVFRKGGSVEDINDLLSYLSDKWTTNELEPIISFQRKVSEQK